MALDPELPAKVKARLDIVDELKDAGGLELKKRGAHYWARCPFHGGGDERTPSLQVTPSKGLWYCHACHEGGDVLDFLQRSTGGKFGEVLHDAAKRAGIVARSESSTANANRPAHTQASPTPPKRLPADPCPPLSDAMLEQLVAWQAALPGSPAADYLAARGIPLDIATAAGVGYAATGWPGKRLAGRPVAVFPLTDAAGTVVSLAARRLGPSEPRWDAMSPKAPFLGHALAGSGQLWIVEGAVDALALCAAGIGRVVAMMGSGWPSLPWNVRDIVLALDADATGLAQAQKMAHRATLLGKRVRILPPVALGGAKDVAEAWLAGTLTLYADQVPDARREEWQERAAIMLDAGVPLAIAEREALRELAG